MSEAASKIDGCIGHQQQAGSIARWRHSKVEDNIAHRRKFRNINDLSLASDDPLGTDLSDIRMVVRSGEILGIAGISGNGQQEMLAALSGERTTPDADVIRLSGMAGAPLGAAARRRLGLRFILEVRLGRAAIPSIALADDALLTAHGRARCGRHAAIRCDQGFRSAPHRRFRCQV